MGKLGYPGWGGQCLYYMATPPGYLRTSDNDLMEQSVRIGWFAGEYVKATMDNIRDWNMTPGIGHFVQLAKANNSKVGCAMIKYKRTETNNTDYQYFTCNFNRVYETHVPQYIEGSPAKACTTGLSVSYPGLCGPEIFPK